MFKFNIYERENNFSKVFALSIPVEANQEIVKFKDFEKVTDKRIIGLGIRRNPSGITTARDVDGRLLVPNDELTQGHLMIEEDGQPMLRNVPLDWLTYDQDNLPGEFAQSLIEGIDIAASYVKFRAGAITNDCAIEFLFVIAPIECLDRTCFTN